MSELLFGPDPEWPEDGEPAYRALASYYREKITSGALPDGTKLPSQHQMVEQSKLLSESVGVEPKRRIRISRR